MKEKCIIDDPNLGILTENDHKLGLCLCIHCTCGKHLCSSKKLFNSQTLKLKSTYISHFTKIPAQHALNNAKTVSPSAKKIFSGMSTYKNDYAKPDMTPNPRVSERVKKTTFSGFLRSSYAKDFIPFSPVKQESMSPYNSRIDTKSIKFTGETTYKNSFANKEPIDVVKSNKKLGKKIFIDPNNYLETSHKRDFQHLEPCKILKNILHESIGVSPKGVPGLSSNQRDFILQYESVRNVPRRLTALKEYMLSKRE